MLTSFQRVEDDLKKQALKQRFEREPLEQLRHKLAQPGSAAVQRLLAPVIVIKHVVLRVTARVASR